MEKDVVDSSKIIYRKYLGVKQYFHGNFDYFKYNGFVNAKLASNLETKKEFWVCAKLYKSYKLDDIEKLFVLNLWDNPNCWLGDLDEKLYKSFDKYVQSRYYLFSEEIKPIFRDSDYNSRFNHSEEFKYTEIYSMYKAKKISKESLLILNMTTKFLDKIYKKHNDFIFEPEYNSLKKLQNFLEVWKVFDTLEMSKKLIEVKKQLDK